MAGVSPEKKEGDEEEEGKKEEEDKIKNLFKEQIGCPVKGGWDEGICVARL